MKIFTLRAKWFLTFAFVAIISTGSLISCDSKDNTAGPSIAQPPTNNLDQTIAVQDRHTDELLAIDGVIGTGTGLHQDGSPAVYVFTNRANVSGIPETIEGIRTHVENIGEITAIDPTHDGDGNKGSLWGAIQAAGFTGTYRAPMYSGVSVGNDKECAAGTISCVVTDIATHTHKYLLSNNHVFARVNAAAIGERIDQQGRYDAIPQCAQTGQVASLSAFIPINFTKRSTNIIDCAIAEISSGINSTSQMAIASYTPTSTPVAATVGLNVKKTGRTTGFTTGTISAINVTTSVSYGSGKTAKYIGQLYISSTTFSAAGDSGSLIVDSSNNPVGLLFAGSSNSTIANPISNVLGTLKVSIVAQ